MSSGYNVRLSSVAEHAVANRDCVRNESFLLTPSDVLDDVSTSCWSRRTLSGGRGKNLNPSRDAKGSPALSSNNGEENKSTV